MRFFLKDQLSSHLPRNRATARVRPYHDTMARRHGRGVPLRSPCLDAASSASRSPYSDAASSALRPPYLNATSSALRSPYSDAASSALQPPCLDATSSASRSPWIRISSFALSFTIFTLICLFTFPLTPTAHADGGAPNLAYVAGTDQGVSIIDVSQQKVTSTVNISGGAHSVLLSTDARFLYVTQPQQNRVAVIGAKQGNTICTANVPGRPTLLALDTNSNNYTLFAAGNGASSVSAIDPTNCSIKHTYQVNGAVYGLAMAQVGSGINGSSGSQLWIADNTSLNIFDDVKQQKLGSIPVPGGPGYVNIPQGETVYATTRQGSVVAVALSSHQLVTLVTGGSYGPMDYDETTGEVYVPDMKSNRLVVLTPVNPGSSTPQEPARVIHLDAQPQSIAITSDGQLGFAALASGDVAMIDIPGRQPINTIHVGGSPKFIITGLYPPALGSTPQQASIYGTLINIAAYALVIALFVIPILLFRRYTKAANVKK